MVDCNVLIVGSGLAGSSAAYHLRRLGVEGVVVVERMSGDSYGRYHRTCGEAVSDRLFALSGAPEGCRVRRIGRIRITCGDVDMDIPVKGHIIDRERLLKDLRDGSGAEFVKASLDSVKADPEGITAVCGDTVYHCRYLIGADGAFSRVRRDVFGTVPEVRFAAVNNLVKGNSDSDTICFEVSTRYPGAYRWDFPSKDGLRSVGYAVGRDSVEDPVETGIRYIVSGTDRRVVEGNCCLIGDAAMLANPLCYGGIGAALISGRKAAEGIAGGNLSGYARWIRKDIMFDRHFMDALDTFKGWGEADYIDAVKPFRKGYSLLRGAYAMLRRPRWANVYMSIWMAFGKGW